MTSKGDVVVTGVSAEDIQAALAAYSATQNLTITVRKEGDDSGNIDEDGEEQNAGTDGVLLREGAYSSLQQRLKKKAKETEKAEKNATKAMASVQTFHQQQKQLFDEFVLLRTRYDEVKGNLMDTLWGKCCEFHPDLKVIPECEDLETFLEDEERVGVYNLGRMLGEGQFATVKACMVSQSRGEQSKRKETLEFGKEYAMKIIEKEKVQTFKALQRTSNEIMILHELVNPHIVCVADIIQTPKKLYIVAEKGGEDLFEFFDEHPDGVPEAWAREIMKRILKGVHYCHENQICHRDLKPENILVSFDADSGSCADLKLCDFGLAAHFAPKQQFTDFCGSPGFFAPEMVIKGSYYGDKADIWSCGCILLELVLGHEQFCEVWMKAYDYEVLQEKQVFVREIDATLEHLVSVLDFSDGLNDFVIKFLNMRASERPDIREMLEHNWLEMTEEDFLAKKEVEKEARIFNHNRRTLILKEDNLRDELKQTFVASLKRGGSSPGRAKALGNGELPDESGEGESDDLVASDLAGSGGSTTTVTRKVIRRHSEGNEAQKADSDEATATANFTVDPKVLQKVYEEMSAKERKMYDQYNTDATGNDKKAQLSLPPIEPQTPNVGAARKILLRGADLANKVASGSQSAASSPSHSNFHSNASSPIHLQSPKGFLRRQDTPAPAYPDSPMLHSSSEGTLSSPALRKQASSGLSSLAENKEEEKEGGGSSNSASRRVSMEEPAPSPSNAGSPDRGKRGEEKGEGRHVQFSESKAGAK